MLEKMSLCGGTGLVYRQLLGKRIEHSILQEGKQKFLKLRISPLISISINNKIMKLIDNYFPKTSLLGSFHLQQSLHFTHSGVVDSSILINWTSPFISFGVSGLISVS